MIHKTEFKNECSLLRSTFKQNLKPKAKIKIYIPEFSHLIIPYFQATRYPNIYHLLSESK